MILVNGSKCIASGFRQSEAGATAVEFAILLPVMMVVFAAIVEGSRIYWNYQSAVSGVRDASRYLARITNADICGGTANTTPVCASSLAVKVAIAWPTPSQTFRVRDSPSSPVRWTPNRRMSVEACHWIKVVTGTSVLLKFPFQNVGTDAKPGW